MGLKASTVTVTTTAAKIVDVGGNPQSVAIVNPAGNATIHIGGSNVDTGDNGFPLAGGSEPLSLDLGPDGDVWAVAGGSVSGVKVLRSA